MKLSIEITKMNVLSTKFYSGVLLSALVLTSGCSSLNSFVLGEKVYADRGTEAAERASGAYTIGAGDTLKITVFNEPDISGEFMVEDNVIALPLIGSIDATGKTLRDFEEHLTTQLDGRFLKDPKVSVEVSNYRPFYILGQVNTPGQYPYTPGLDIINAIAVAGGFTTRANEDLVFIKKFGDSEENLFRLSNSIKLLPGDTVRVAPRYF